MPDFTSSLYLDMKHCSAELQSWSQLTTGTPAVLAESKESKNLGNYIANMQGIETGIVAPSTLHLYLDLFDLLSRKKITVFIDEKIYPVSKYGIEKLIVKNIPIYVFKHLDANHLCKLVKEKLQKFTAPVVLTDGYCPQCGKAAPLKNYSLILQPYNGKIFIDDTQAFGIFGKRKDDFVYGYGGGGTLQWLNMHDENIVTVVSLAKAFGVPSAVIAGNKNFISAFKNTSKTRESSSPVSAAHLSAANNAIIINKKYGDEKRKKLLKNILLVRKKLMHAGIELSGGLFPVQCITSLNYNDTINLFERLIDSNIKTVITENHKAKKTVITFIINADHSASEIHSLAFTCKSFLVARLLNQTV